MRSMSCWHVITFGTILVLLAACSNTHYAGEPVAALGFATQKHVGRPSLLHPVGNPLSVAKIDLGRKLFHDKRLSADGSVSCGTCHNPEQGYTQTDTATPLGIGQQRGTRNAPSLYDVGYRKTLFHDGRAATLEEQYKGPLLHPREMGNASIDDVVERIRGMKDYQRFFAYAFANEVSVGTIGKALGSYQRALVTGPNRFDQWRFGGKADALSEREIAGYRVFVDRAKCSSCHVIRETSAELTDDRFSKNGYARMRTGAGAFDPGREKVTQLAEDRFAFRTPTLRNVALTAPYMHDGAIETLSDVVAFYSSTGLRRIAANGAATTLSSQEQADLVAFLKSLTSQVRP
jgi:cytochrome c peroxidase